MSKDDNPPPKTWRIAVFRDLERLFEMDVPTNRLLDSAVPAFLTALVLKYEELSDEEFVGSHLNKRCGGPRGLKVTVCPQQYDKTRSRMNRTALGPTISAMIYWTVSPEVAQHIADFER